jgi:flavin reductase (DIM6/NTAB) family NADH-FMN oxidoreductase RutF
VPAHPVDLFRRLTNGVYVVGVAHGARRNAFTAAWITQVSFDPLLVALSVNPGHFSYPLLAASKAFTVSFLAASQLEVARHFGTQSGRDVDKLAGQPWAPTASGLPFLSNAVAYLECQVEGEHPAGDHRLVLARVTGGELLSPDTPVLRYSDTGNLDGSAALYPGRF